MTLVLDTNVLIAAFATQGICHALFELCIDQYRIVLNDFIVEEVADKLGKKLKLPQSVIRSITRYLGENTEMVCHGRLGKRVRRDPKDDWVLALAQSSGADYIITEDEDLLMLERFGPTAIVSPRRFWEILRAKKPEKG
jgi:hypothetical protein